MKKEMKILILKGENAVAFSSRSAHDISFIRGVAKQRN